MRNAARDVAIDPTGRAAGRGAYVCATSECIDIAIKKGALARALNIPLPADLREALMAGAADPMHTTEGGARGQE